MSTAIEVGAKTKREIASITKDMPKVGEAWEGGYFSGFFVFDGSIYGQATAPKSTGEHAPTVWHSKNVLIPGANSFVDGLANSQAMAKAGSKVASWAMEQSINGFSDWHIGARDQVELQYRLLKPTKEHNYAYRHGDNPSSFPAGYPYTLHLPGQTDVELFREGGSEAFEAAAYLSSTQYSALDAWFQLFVDGYQVIWSESDEARVRLVRRLKLSSFNPF
ncbi:MAG: hypothetical protein ACRYGG_21440 [Janthinobacterium lividum]